MGFLEATSRTTGESGHAIPTLSRPHPRSNCHSDLDHSSALPQKLAASLAHKHGCLPPKVWNSSWPLGLDMLAKALQYARSMQILQFFMDVVEANGHTFEQRLLGAKGIDTVDPRIVEAVLSSNFSGMIQCVVT